MSDLANIDKGPLSVPDFLKEVKGNEGLENVTKNDIVLPRLAICQSGTPQRKRDNPAYIKGLDEGMFFNTVSQQVYGDKVELIPLLKTQSRIFFRDINEGGGILCRSFNGINGGTLCETCMACPKSVGFPSECTEFKNITSIVAADGNLIVASFKSTGLAAAKAWLTRMSMMNKPAYVGVYELSLSSMRNAQGEFYVPKVAFKRFVTEIEFTAAKHEYELLKGKTIQTDEELEHDAPVRDAGDETSPF